MLPAQSYYRLTTHPNPPDYVNNIEQNDTYLLVNCAGYENLQHPFYRIQPGGRNDYYMMYMCGGTLDAATGDTADTVTLSPGHLFIIPPHTFFRYKPVGNDAIQYFWVHFTGYSVSDLLSDCSLPLLTPCDVGSPEDIEDKYQELFKVFMHRDPCMDTAAVSRLMDICVLFGRILQRHGMDNYSTSPKHHKLSASLSYIYENLSSPLSIPALAEMENLKVSRYRALFFEIFGISPLAYITNLRMQRAVALLSLTNLPISQIASAVGYEDPLYFSRSFRQRFHVSPTTYRKQNGSAFL